MKFLLPILAILLPISSYALNIEDKCAEDAEKKFFIMKDYAEGKISRTEAVKKASDLNVYNFNGKGHALIINKARFLDTLDTFKEVVTDTSPEERKFIYFISHQALFRACMSELE